MTLKTLDSNFFIMKLCTVGPISLIVSVRIPGIFNTRKINSSIRNRLDIISQILNAIYHRAEEQGFT